MNMESCKNNVIFIMQLIYHIREKPGTQKYSSTLPPMSFLQKKTFVLYYPIIEGLE